MENKGKLIPLGANPMNHYTKWSDIDYYRGLSPSNIILSVSFSLSASQILHCFLNYQNLCCLLGKGFVVYKPH